MIYIISKELQHHGVKGMKWGVRHDPVSTGGRRSSGKKKMSTAKKVAIGLAVTAAAAGLTYAAIKSGKAQQIARGASRLVKSRKSKPMSGYELRKMGISTFEPHTIDISGNYVTKSGVNRSAARINYYNRHGTAYSKTNITRARKLQGYSNKNYTELGRARYKQKLAQTKYDANMAKFRKYTQEGQRFANDPKTAKAYEMDRRILAEQVLKSRDRLGNAQYNSIEAVNKIYNTKGRVSYKEVKPIKFRKLS